MPPAGHDEVAGAVRYRPTDREGTRFRVAFLYAYRVDRGIG